MTKPVVTVRSRPGGWVCRVDFVAHVADLSENQMAQYLPVDHMAHLPGGSLACVTVSCRVLPREGQTILAELRVASSNWSAECETWARNTFTRTVESAFVALANAGIAPVEGSEVEIVAYYAKGVEETVEMFAQYLGVMVSVRQEFYAGVRRADEREQRAAVRRAAREVEEAQRWWNRLKSLFFPPVPQTPSLPRSRVLPVDLWEEKAELFSSTFLGVCENGMGSLLRRVTIRDPAIAAHLQLHEGVVYGESKTMAVDRGEKPMVTRVHSGVFRRSPIFDDDDEVSDVDAPSPRGLGLYETRFTPKNK